MRPQRLRPRSIRRESASCPTGCGSRPTPRARLSALESTPAPSRAVGDDVRLLQRDVASADPLPRVGCEEILDEKRHAAERAVGQIGACGDLAGMVKPADHDRVQHRIDAFDALDRRLQQLAWRYFA